MKQRLDPIWIGLACAGCAAYQPAPLDLAGHDLEWRTRHERMPGPADGLPVDGDPSDGLELAEAELAALVFHPRLRLAAQRYLAAQVRAGAAGVLPDPVLSAEVLRITEDVPDRWVVTPSLAFTVPLSARREAARGRASAEVRGAYQAIAEEERRVLLDLRAAWIEFTAAHVRAAAGEALLAELDELHERARELADLGEVLRSEAAAVRLERAHLAQAVLRDRSALAAGGLRLRAAIGLAPSAPVEFVPGVTLPSFDPDPAGVLEGHPTLARLAEEHAAAEEALREAHEARTPDLTLGPLLESDEGQGRVGLLSGLPLPLWDGNRFAIAEAEAARSLASLAFEVATEELAGELALAADGLERATAELQVLEAELGPAMEEWLALARSELAVGEGSPVDLLAVLGRGHEAQLATIEARAAQARARAEVLFLTGAKEDDR